MEAGQIFNNIIQNNTPNGDVWGFCHGFQKKKKEFEPFSETSVDSMAAKPTQVFPLVSAGLEIGSYRPWDGTQSLILPKTYFLCISCNLSAASSNLSPCTQDKPVQKWEKQHCVIYRAANAIYIKTHVGWCLVNSCSGQLSEYFDTLSMTNNFLVLKSIIFITRKRKCYAKSQVHLSRVILTK